MLAIPFEVILWYGDNVFIGHLRQLCRHFGPLQLCPRELCYNNLGSYYKCGRFAAPHGELLERDKTIGTGTSLSGCTSTSLGRGTVIIVTNPYTVWDMPPAAYLHARIAIFHDVPRPKMMLARFIGSSAMAYVDTAPFDPTGRNEYMAYIRTPWARKFEFFRSSLPPDHSIWRDRGAVWHITHY